MGALSGMTFSASQTGLLAYPSPRERQSQFTWLDETGKLIRRVGKPGTYVTFALSNDGQRLAFARLTDQRILLWQLDVQRGVESQLTFKAQGEGDPRWMNARDLAVTRRPLGVVRLGADGRESVLLSDGSAARRVPRRPRPARSEKRRAAGRTHRRHEGHDGMRRPASGSIDQAQFAPDGQTVAYNADETGRWEVYITSLTSSGERVQVSGNGGVQPVWRRDGRQLYLLGPEGHVVQRAHRPEWATSGWDASPVVHNRPEGTLAVR